MAKLSGIVAVFAMVVMTGCGGDDEVTAKNVDCLDSVPAYFALGCLGGTLANNLDQCDTAQQIIQDTAKECMDEYRGYQFCCYRATECDQCDALLTRLQTCLGV